MGTFPIWSAFFLLVSISPFVSAGIYTNYISFKDKTFLFRGFTHLKAAPAEQFLKSWVKEAYEDMKKETLKSDDMPTPSTMSVGFWPTGIEGGAGYLIFHSSIRGGPVNSENDFDYQNNCTIGTVKAAGMCAEMGNIILANQKDLISSQANPMFAVFGRISKTTSVPQYLPPCRGKDMRGGCGNIAKNANIKSLCILKREPFPEPIDNPLDERDTELEARGKGGKGRKGGKGGKGKKSKDKEQTDSPTSTQHIVATTTPTPQATTTPTSSQSAISSQQATSSQQVTSTATTILVSSEAGSSTVNTLTTASHAITSGDACKVSSAVQDLADSKSIPMPTGIDTMETKTRTRTTHVTAHETKTYV